MKNITPEMGLFFNRLLAIKQSLKLLAVEKSDDKIMSIYEKLHDLIKETDDE